MDSRGTESGMLSTDSSNMEEDPHLCLPCVTNTDQETFQIFHKLYTTWLDTQELVTIEQIGEDLGGTVIAPIWETYRTEITSSTGEFERSRRFPHYDRGVPTRSDISPRRIGETFDPSRQTRYWQYQARLAVNSVTLGDFSRPLQISKFIKDVHAGFQLLNLKNDVLRRRSDGIKYNVSIPEVVWTLRICWIATLGEKGWRGSIRVDHQELDAQGLILAGGQLTDR